MCNDWMRDSRHPFRSMWGAYGWDVRLPHEPACYDDSMPVPSNSGTSFFDSLFSGEQCEEVNWFDGALASRGWPQFQGVADAVLGFDENIASFCLGRDPDDEPPAGWQRAHPEWCASANHNILALYSNKPSYNICRNLEWQTCAAMGRLPGMDSGKGQKRNIVFSVAPRDLKISHTTHHPFGRCSGWSPSKCSVPGKLEYGCA